MRLNFDELAMFLRREQNSLHYKPNEQRSRGRPGDGGEFMHGYSQAIDGLTARMVSEFTHAKGFDAARFIAIVKGEIEPTILKYSLR